MLASDKGQPERSVATPSQQMSWKWACDGWGRAVPQLAATLPFLVRGRTDELTNSVDRAPVPCGLFSRRGRQAPRPRFPWSLVDVGSPTSRPKRLHQSTLMLWYISSTGPTLAHAPRARTPRPGPPPTPPWGPLFLKKEKERGVPGHQTMIPELNQRIGGVAW
jgi:hypothetical protein